MKTTVLGIRLNDYQRDRLKEKALEKGCIEADIVRELVDNYIEGKIADTSRLAIQAKKRKVSLQTLIDAIVEQLDESSRVKRK